MPHVCMIGYGFHPPWIEGCSNIGKNLYLSLSDKVDLSLISLVRMDYFARARANGTTRKDIRPFCIHPLWLFKSFHIKGRSFSPSLIFDAPRIISAIKYLERDKKIDILHIHNISHIAMSLLSKIILRKKTLLHFFNIPHYRDVFCNPLVEGFLCTSKLGQNYLYSKGIPKYKVQVLSPIIDIDNYRPMPIDQCKEQIQISKDSFLVTYVGNLYPQRFPPQTIDVIENITKDYQNVKLSIFAPDSVQNRTLASHLYYSLRRSSIDFKITLSNLSESERAIAYNASNVIIFPFLNELSGLIVGVDPPLTILEAMACGKIVIASKVLSVGDVIQNNRNGFLFTPGNFKELKNILQKVIANYDNLLSIETSAQATIINCFSHNVSNDLLNIYETIVKN